MSAGVGAQEAAPVAGLRERKKMRTRAGLQAAALRLFAEQGYAQTSVEQIAAAAEVSPSTFFRYFATKEETVLADFIDHRVLDGVRAAPGRLTPVEALRWAILRTRETVSDEELALEQQRNRLILSEPELRRGLVEEMHRPMKLLGDAIADRLDRSRDDPYCAAYAGAIIGGLVSVSGIETVREADYFERVTDGLDAVAGVVRRPVRGGRAN